MQKDSCFSFERIPAPLLAWYQTHKRALPWRENPTPYRVWVSEIMLQQTRVEAVKEYYLRFMDALPDVESLANCAEEKLLKLWEGLGYYSRVRNMQKAARQILTWFDGEFPSDIKELQSLSGIGSYTAGAIASIAFGQPTAAVDGNVFRVISRLSQNPTVISEPSYRKYLERELSAVYPATKEGCSQFTQSLFELGALICKPQNPDCQNCPLQFLCGAYQNGTQACFPVLPQKKEKRREKVYMFIMQTREGICIRRRERGVLAGMNEFPSHVVTGSETIENVLNAWGVYAFNVKKRRNYKHIFTHIVWDMDCVWLETESAPFDAYSLSEIEESISLPTAFKQCLSMLENK